MTAAANGRVDIAGQGVFDNDKGAMQEYKHCPGASVSLMPTMIILRAHAITQIGWNHIMRCEYMVIECYYEEDYKQIHCVSINNLFWITKTQMFDISFRDGWTDEELASMTKKYLRNLLSSSSSSASRCVYSIRQRGRG